MKAFLLALLFPLAAFAQIPPPVVLKSQGGQKQTFKYNLNVPNNGVTPLGGLDVLLETGAQNVLANPGFEANPQLTGWTCANFSCVNNTTYFSDGKQGMTVSNANTVNAVVEQSVTPTFPTANRPFQYGMFVNTNAAGFQVCSLFNGVEQGCADVPSTATTTFVLAPIYQPSTNGTVGVRLKSINTNAKQVFFDGGYVGSVQISSGYPAVPAQGYTPTFAGATVTPAYCTYTQVQNFYDIACRITITATTASTFTMSLPNGLNADSVTYTSNMSYSQVGRMATTATLGAGASGYLGGFNTLALGGSNLIYFGEESASASPGAPQTGSAIGTGTFILNAHVAMSGLAPQTAIQTQNSNYDWRPYTPTFMGLGTVTVANANDCQEKREGPDNLIRCKFTNGTTTATEARVSTPYTVASTFSSIQLAGVAAQNLGTASGFYMLKEPGVQYLTFGLQGTSSGALAKQQGSGIFSSGQVVSFEARYPVLGWSENQNAPQLIGSVLSPASAVTVHIAGTIAGSSTTPTIQSGGAGVSSLTRNALGDVTVNFTAGTMSTLYGCTCTHTNAIADARAADVCGIGTLTSSAVRFLIYNPASSAYFDDNFSFACDGAK